MPSGFGLVTNSEGALPDGSQKAGGLAEFLGIPGNVSSRTVWSGADLAHLVLDTECVSSCEVFGQLQQREALRGRSPGEERWDQEEQKSSSGNKEPEHIGNRCAEERRGAERKKLWSARGSLQTQRVHERGAFLGVIKKGHCTFISARRTLWTLDGEKVAINMRYWVYAWCLLEGNIALTTQTLNICTHGTTIHC